VVQTLLLLIGNDVMGVCMAVDGGRILYAAGNGNGYQRV